jgi:DnaJ-class molecular chaperone
MQPIVCPRCNGRGKSVRIREREHISAAWYTWQECPACRGTGYQLNHLSTPRRAGASLYQQAITLTACLAGAGGKQPSPAQILGLATRRF